MWKASLRVGDLTLPVRLYAAASDRKVHFRLLCAADHSPVSQQMVDPASGEAIAPGDVRRGIEVDDGLFVVVTEADQKALEPEPSRDIRVAQFVDREKVDPRWVERPYYLGPDGDEDGYFALAAALEHLGKAGISRWVMRKKPYAGALYGRDGILMLDLLRPAEEIVSVSGLRPGPGRAPDKRELSLADKLIEALEDDFDATAYTDTYGDRVRQLIDAKLAGKKLPAQARKPARRREQSLADSLEQSLAQRRSARG